MKYLLFIFFLLISATTLFTQSDSTPIKRHFAATKDFALASPQLKFKNHLFTDTLSVSAEFQLKGSQLYYTLDGSPPTSNALLYKAPILLSKSTTLKIRAYYKDLQPSEIKTVTFLKVNQQLPIKSIRLEHPPSEQYAGKGAKTLIDLQKGGANFKTQQWLGFNGNDAVIDIAFSKKQRLHQIIVSTLSDAGSWIFPPSSIEIWMAKRKRKHQLIAQKNIPPLNKNSSKTVDYLTLSFKPKKGQYLRVIVKSTPTIPDWHDGRGTPAWLFLDEVIFN